MADSVVSYNPGCPDPVVEEVVLERSYIIIPEPDDLYTSPTYMNMQSYTSYLGYSRGFNLSYSGEVGTFEFRLFDFEVDAIMGYDYNSHTDPLELTLPFPADFSLSENGIEATYAEGSWATEAQILRVIPFWHEAE